MIGNLSEDQIEALLSEQFVGRIGCHTNDMVYVVPISYVYEGKNIFAHTSEGLKIELMRKNPEVCFQVDNLKDMSNWQSVIAWGRFEEITAADEKDSALELLIKRPLPFLSSRTTHLGKTWPFEDSLSNIDGIVFKIVLDVCTGKFESNSTSAKIVG